MGLVHNKTKRWTTHGSYQSSTRLNEANLRTQVALVKTTELRKRSGTDLVGNIQSIVITC